jgi:hypothetical protein
MAIDLSAIRKKLNQLSGVSSKRNITWRPEEGQEYQVRLLSFPNNDGQPFKEVMFYYNIGSNAGLVAPNQFGLPDPVQELINKLKTDGSKESYELAKKLYPKMRCYAPVIVRGEEDKGIRIWAFGKTLYQNILNIMLDEDFGDITDVQSGFDLKITCTKAPGKQFADTSIRPRNKSTALADTPAQIQKLLDTMPDTSEMFETKSYKELENIVNAWLNGDESTGSTRGFNDDDDSIKPNDFTPQAKSEPAKSKSYEQQPKTSKFSSLDDAFADLED